MHLKFACVDKVNVYETSHTLSLQVNQICLCKFYPPHNPIRVIAVLCNKAFEIDQAFHMAIWLLLTLISVHASSFLLRKKSIFVLFTLIYSLSCLPVLTLQALIFPALANQCHHWISGCLSPCSKPLPWGHWPFCLCPVLGDSRLFCPLLILSWISCLGAYKSGHPNSPLHNFFSSGLEASGAEACYSILNQMPFLFHHWPIPDACPKLA